MSIINLEKTFENSKLVYFSLDNKIIECICLTELYIYYVNYYYNTNLKKCCDKVKIITIYDIYKNIIYEPIQTNLFKKPIKNGMILESFKKNIFFFKTFIEAFIQNNKLNGIEYHINYNGTMTKFLYNDISLEIDGSIKKFNIYNNKGKHIHEIQFNNDSIICHKNYNNLITYNIYKNYIKIRKGNLPFCITVWYNLKELKFLKIQKYYKNIQLDEMRNNNNEIIYYNEYRKCKLIECNHKYNNPPFSKPIIKFCIRLINYYKKNINKYNKLIKYCLKKEKIVYNNLLLKYKLEIINSK